MRNPPMTPWRALAVDQGMALARKIFEKRGGHSEIHVTERDLAAMLALAFEVGAEQAAAVAKV